MLRTALNFSLFRTSSDLYGEILHTKMQSPGILLRSQNVLFSSGSSNQKPSLSICEPSFIQLTIIKTVSISISMKMEMQKLTLSVLTMRSVILQELKNCAYFVHHGKSKSSLGFSICYLQTMFSFSIFLKYLNFTRRCKLCEDCNTWDHLPYVIVI